MPDTYSKTDRTPCRRVPPPRRQCRVARVLVLDQDADAGRAIQAALLVGGFATEAACEPRAMRAALRERPYDVVVLDHVLAGKSPGYLARLLLAKQPDAGLVVVRTDAQRRIYELDLRPLAELDAWLEPYRRRWERSLDALERHLDRTPTPTSMPPGQSRRARGSTRSPHAAIGFVRAAMKAAGSGGRACPTPHFVVGHLQNPAGDGAIPS